MCLILFKYTNSPKNTINNNFQVIKISKNIFMQKSVKICHILLGNFKIKKYIYYYTKMIIGTCNYMFTTFQDRQIIE